MAILNNSNAISTGGYDINNSLRFRSSATAYLNRTFGTPTNNKIFTYSVWVKRGALGADYALLSPASTGTGYTTFRFESDNTINFQEFTGSAYNYQLDTTQVFRDPSAWYHLVVAVDTTQGTASNRIKLYVNGNQVTAFATATYPTQNLNPFFNSAVVHRVGANNYTGNVEQPYDGYMADVYFIDGQALTPSSFGETDTTTGVWKPKAYTGTYGTNGFYLKFSDIATTSGSNAGLGKDFSGNTNYWTTNNISVTSGTTYDAMKDSPTNTSATVANYAVMNPLDKGTSLSISDANLTVSTTAASWFSISSTIKTSEKIYAECTYKSTGGSSTHEFGIRVSNLSNISSVEPFGDANGAGVLWNNVEYKSRTSGVETNTVTTTVAIGSVFQIAFDANNGNLWVGKDNSWLGGGNPSTNTTPTYTGLTNTNGYNIVSALNLTSSIAVNFGQQPFSYTPPTGFVALNTYNLPTPTILQGNKYMDATLYTGNSSTQTVTNAGSFKPDFVWIKDRTTAYPNMLFDSVRGASKRLISNTTDTEATETDTQTSFNSNGFSVSTNLVVNRSSDAFVGWQWQAGQGSTSSNTSGSITSTVSVNTTAGFSIVTYTGTGANATVGHGLGVAPKMVIVKNRSISSAWRVWFTGLSGTEQLNLNETGGKETGQITWNSTVPSSTVFSLGTPAAVNGSGNSLVAYCWADVSGFSKAFSYTGNGNADGPFVFTNFRPKFVLFKNSSAVTDWNILDTSRNTYNVTGLTLQPDNSGAEQSGWNIDVLSNGFKIRTTLTDLNGNGNTIIGMAFAENPFKNSLAR